MKLIVVSKTLNDIESSEALITSFKNTLGMDFQFLLINPEDIKYKITEIKKINDRMARKSAGLDGENVYVLMQSDTLSPICQNALLKTLEESNSSMVLVVKNIETLLPTVKSRCQTKFIEVDESEKSVVEIVDLFGYDDIPGMSKLERNKVKEQLDKMLNSAVKPTDKQIVHIHEAIRKIDSNCKVESVLFELLWKIK